MMQKRSQVYANRDKDPQIELIINMPSKDRNSLEPVERSHIETSHKGYGNKLLNIKESLKIWKT